MVEAKILPMFKKYPDDLLNDQVLKDTVHMLTKGMSVNGYLMFAMHRMRQFCVLEALSFKFSSLL